ncbi:replication endonuclease [Alkalimonas sp. NCh-2]|uniref:replication endonuclease n=1 Tax=Alkalimonas sp. NCh-2 TaxID=3144846 RepID=UPI0031F5FE00
MMWQQQDLFQIYNRVNHPDHYDVNWMKGRIAGLPSRIRNKLQKVFYTDALTLPARERNTNLRHAADPIRRKIKPLYMALKRFSFGYKSIATKEATRKTAAAIASDIYRALAERAEYAQTQYQDYNDCLADCYSWICQYSLDHHPEVQPPFWSNEQELPEPEFMEVALLKIKCDRWWCRKLLVVRKRYLETLEIVAGNVGQQSPYASKQAVTEWARDQQATQQWAESGELVNQSGQVISLEQALAAGMGDPENMRCELMKRISGLEDYAEEMQLQGLFFTLTAPSKYHPKSKNWNGATPKQAQSYLVDVWGLVRAALGRRNISYFGVRVAEPHKDGCPHWHLLIWCEPSKAKQLCRIVKRYFCQEDKHELIARFKHRKALRKQYRKRRQLYGYFKSLGQKVKAPAKSYWPSAPRFTVETIETTPRDESGKRQGGAAAYIAKYIAKNINAKGVESLVCEETGKVVADIINHVQAWKSRWGIRQFQFQGCDPITVYRELRRVRQSIDAEKLELIRQGAESELFIDFIRAMKEVDCGLAYEVEPMANQYGEAAKRVKGVTVGNVTAWTRSEKWQLRRKACSSVGEADLSWTSGNNCTPRSLGHKFDALGIDAEAMALMERGCTVTIGIEKWRVGRYGQIEPAPTMKYATPWDPKNPDFTLIEY